MWRHQVPVSLDGSLSPAEYVVGTNACKGLINADLDVTKLFFALMKVLISSYSNAI